MLRAVAACAVVYSHAYSRAERAWAIHIGRSIVDGIPAVTELGHFGVDLFFILSGFLMVRLHRDGFGRPGMCTEFFIRRLMRIVPIYWLLTTVGAALLFCAPQIFSYHKGIEWPWLLGCYSFIPWPMSDGFSSPLLGAGWTLDYEMYFYALFAIALSFRGGLRLLGCALTVSAIAGTVIIPRYPWLQLLTSPLLMEFVFGALIALYSSRVQPARQAAWGMLVLAIVLIAVGGAAYAHFPPAAIRAEPADWTRVWAWGVPASLLLACTLWLDCGCRSWAGKALVTVGDASYSIYLFQIFALPALADALRWIKVPAVLQVDVAIALLWLLACAAGVGFWACVERPMTNRLKSLLRPRTAALVTG